MKKAIMFDRIANSNNQCIHTHEQCGLQQPNGTQVNQSRKRENGIKYSAYLTEDGKEAGSIRLN